MLEGQKIQQSKDSVIECRAVFAKSRGCLFADVRTVCESVAKGIEKLLFIKCRMRNSLFMNK